MDELDYLEHTVDYEHKVDKGLLCEKEVIVYAPVKTGTDTLYQSVGEYLKTRNGWDGFCSKLLHSHSNKTVIDNIRSECVGFDLEFLSTRWVVKDIVEYARKHGRPVTVLSSFREPVSRSISGVFQIIDQLVNFDHEIRLEDVSLVRCAKQVRDDFLGVARFQHPIEEIEPDFFDKEVFDKEQKFLLVDRGHYRILMLCLEHSDRWQHILEHEMEFEGIEVRGHNQTSEKRVSSLYAEFKKWLSLPDELIWSTYYDSPFVKYLKWFYTDEEIDKFYEKSLQLYGSKKKAAVDPTGTTETPGSELHYSCQKDAVNAADIMIRAAEILPDRRGYRIAASIRNIGNTTWLPGKHRVGGVAVALRARDEKGQYITSNWHGIEQDVMPEHTVDIDVQFEVPLNIVNYKWSVDLIARGVAWFGDNGSKPL